MSAAAQKAINDLNEALKAFEDAQKKGDYAAMGAAWKRVKDAQAALAAAGKAAPKPSSSPSPSGSPSPSATPSATPSSS